MAPPSHMCCLLTAVATVTIPVPAKWVVLVSLLVSARLSKSALWLRGNRGHKLFLNMRGIS